MRIIIYILQKEFLQIFRNKMMLPVIFIVPFVQLLIIVNVATFQMKNIKMEIVDMDMSSTSKQLTAKLSGSPFFIITGQSFSYKNSEENLKKGLNDVILQFPPDFEKKLVKEGKAEVFLGINAINSMTAALTNAYTNAVIMDFNKNISALNNTQTTKPLPYKQININYQHWYNPELRYLNFMVPGILVLLVTMIGLILAAMNIVREKEIGTIEQINVTPIHKSQFIVGKLLPFWMIGLFELALGLTIGKLVFNIPILGSLPLLFLVAGIYLIIVLSVGLIISTITNTQQQAMFIAFFFIMIFLLMSGLFTAIENMPLWAQYFDYINPLAYFIRIIRMILLKGSGFTDIINDFSVLLFFAISILALSIRRYRKTS